MMVNGMGKCVFRIIPLTYIPLTFLPAFPSFIPSVVAAGRAVFLCGCPFLGFAGDGMKIRRRIAISGGCIAFVPHADYLIIASNFCQALVANHNPRPRRLHAEENHG